MAPLIADEKCRPQRRPTFFFFRDGDAGRLDVERQEFDGDLTGSQMRRRGRKDYSQFLKGQKKQQ